MKTRENPIPELRIVRYIDGVIWSTSGTIEEAEEAAKKYRDAEIAVIL